MFHLGRCHTHRPPPGLRAAAASTQVLPAGRRLARPFAVINFQNIVHCFIKANIKYLLFRLASVLILYCTFYLTLPCQNLHFHAVSIVVKVKLQLLDQQA